MSRSIARNGAPGRRGLTWPTLIVIVLVLGVLVALLLPAISTAREAARRVQCNSNMKQIGLALHNYHQAMKAFPPGTICASDPIQPGNQYDVWTEAAQTGPGFHGTSIFTRILPYVEGSDVWLNHSYGICSSEETSGRGGMSNFVFVNCDLPGFYCPSRRDAFRPEDEVMMLSSDWTGGGTDYGGCAGRHAAFTLETGYNLCDASTLYEPNYQPEQLAEEDDGEEKRWGIFGRVNVSSTMEEVRDGTGCTIMTGELQRITDVSPGSKDGWAIGGPATLFTTGAVPLQEWTIGRGQDRFLGRPMNNRFFGSPGSEHSGGAHFGLADGSVTFLNESMDPGVFFLMGSMDDGVKDLDY